MKIFIGSVILTGVLAVVIAGTKEKTLVFENKNVQIPTETRVITFEPEAQETVKNSQVSVEGMIAQYFKDHVTMVAIARAESGLDPEKESDTDRMADGRAFSIGVFQVNLTWHRIGDLNCPEAFEGKDYRATVVDEDLYQSCVKAAKDPIKNIEASIKIPLHHWGAFTNQSYKKYL